MLLESTLTLFKTLSPPIRKKDKMHDHYQAGRYEWESPMSYFPQKQMQAE